MGRLLAPYGVKGWLRVQSYAASPHSLCEYSQWWVHVESEWVCVEVEDSRVQHQGLIVKFVGFEDREQVTKLRSSEFGVRRDQLPELPEEEYYWHELVGFSVINTKGEDLGVIDHLFDSGAQPVIVLKDGKEERLIPWIDHVIERIDTGNRILAVDWELDY
ncbi:MAG: ribosome maturation factor RimM [Proteobacteria bacterium]|nr:ribosome maturation factor RimM [Pseudomonadota bacterium]